MTPEQIEELRQLREAAIAEVESGPSRVKHLDYVCKLLERASQLINAAEQLAAAQRESACHCCTNGEIDGRPCTECRGTGKIAVAYDVVRVALAAARAELDKAWEEFRGMSVRAGASVSRLEAALAAAREDTARLKAVLDAETICQTCEGTGVMGDTCPQCDAMGYVSKSCGECGGCGHWEDVCAECDGIGRSFRGDAAKALYDTQKTAEAVALDAAQDDRAATRQHS